MYTCDTFPYEVFDKVKSYSFRGNHGGERRPRVRDCYCAFDIETTRIKAIEQAVMYIWQFDMYIDGTHYTVTGRLWSEFKVFLTRLNDRVGEKERLIVFVHNLSFEYQFLKGIFDFSPDSVFCMSRRKIAKADWHGIEFRCSYILTNEGLDHFLKSMHVDHKKIEGFDYKKARYFFTPLSDFELSYCVNDVVGLTEGIQAYCKSTGDTLATLPLTQTGFVRRDAKQVIKSSGYQTNRLIPDLNVLKLLHTAFRGGNVHGNRFTTGETQKGVHSIDINSSYPNIICNYDRFPVGPYHKVREANYYKMLDSKKCLLFRAKMYGVKLNDPFEPIPYLAKGNCIFVSSRVASDNGRILSAQSIELVITDIDWSIIREQYFIADMVIEEMYCANPGFLPLAFRMLTMKYYTKKSALKGVEGMDIEYALNKARLNSLYGLCAQWALKPNIQFVKGHVDEYGDINEYVVEFDEAVLYDKYNRTGWLPYQWGVVISAAARRALQDMINYIRSKGGIVLYCDTDSVKYLGNVDIKPFNDRLQAISTKNGAYADDKNGVTHYLGMFEQDGEYKTFRHLGAKRYVYTDKKDELHITIAGVPKASGCKLLADAGGLEAFVENLEFDEDKLDKLEAVYNDCINDTYEIDGHIIEITDNVVLRPSTYTLTLSDDYAELLKNNKMTSFLLDAMPDRVLQYSQRSTVR